MAGPLSDSMRRRLQKEQEAYDGHGDGGTDETDGAYPALPSDLAADEAMKQKGGLLHLKFSREKKNVTQNFVTKIKYLSMIMCL